MKVLVINASAKGKASNTLQLTNAFLEGVRSKTEIDVKTVELYAMDLHPCRGCFACWNKTPGQCVIHDEMEGILKEILDADWIVFSFPLYYFSMPSRMKLVFDRQLPLSLPFMSAQSESGSHPSRYDLSHKKWLFISTCGFYTSKGNYDALDAMLERIYGKDGYTSIYCGEGELFRVPEMKAICRSYLELVRQAGSELVGQNAIAPKTAERLERPMLERSVFERLADASWGIETEDGAPGSEVYTFTCQMAALYDPKAYDKERVVEFLYTDVNERFQIVLDPKGAEVKTDNFLPYTTRIETPYEVWKSIAQEKIRGDEALMKGLYSVDGDFDLLLKWDDLFGKGRPKPVETGPRTNMLYFLVPWMILWSVMPFDIRLAQILLVLGLAILFLTGEKFRFTLYDRLAWVLNSVFAILLSFVAETTVLSFSYLAFGVLWLGSLLGKVPLSAWYSMNDYGGKDAWNNPLFMKTNKILSACWGILYVLLFMMPGLPQAAAWIAPALLGLFTLWFQKWYPAHVARNGS